MSKIIIDVNENLVEQIVRNRTKALQEQLDDANVRLNESENVQSDTDAICVDHELRLTMLELGIIE